MCQGEFSTLDPRCINYNFVECGTCYFCGYLLDKEVWSKLDEMLKHDVTCHMYLWAKSEL